MNVALVTGAGSGLGRGLCEQLAAKQWQVVATDLFLDSVEQTCAALPSSTEPIPLELNVSDQRQVEAVVQSLSRIDLLVNNAGLQRVAPLESFEMDQWEKLIQVMLQGPARMTQAVLPTMRAANYGRIVNIGSIHSLVASPYKSAYVAAKHGLLGLAKTVALETADVDITINTICPSYIRTPLVEKQIAEQAQAHGMPEEEVINKIMLEPMPKKAFITVEEVAATIEFLVSSAARNITGQTITIDGGWTIR